MPKMNRREFIKSTAIVGVASEIAISVGRVSLPVDMTLTYNSSVKNGFLPSTVVSNSIVLLTKKNGLKRKYYEGTWKNLDEMLKTESLEEKIVYNFLFDTKKKDNFGYTYSGFIHIPISGIYQFEITSDDSSRLLINNIILIDNDGLHSRKTYSKSIELKKGMHPIEMQFFERGGQEYFFVQWSRSEFEKMSIPPNNFYLKHD